jgi:phenylalanyl-tRNA synthetase alpha chain
MEAIVETLHDIEKKVLLALKELGDGVSNKIIEENTKLPEASVNRGVELLKEKGFITIEETLKELFLTEKLGAEYTTKLLPEKRFLHTIKDKELKINEITEKAKLDKNEFNVAIGLLKKNDMIDIKGDRIAITSDGKKLLEKKGGEEELLKLLLHKRYLDEIPDELRMYIQPLFERSLIRRETEKIKRLFVTNEGKKILPHIRIEDKIDLLTQGMILSGKWKGKEFRKYNIQAPAPPLMIGKKQPYRKFVDDVKQKMIALGFEEMSGPFVELSFFNNDALYMPQDHPAREIHDTFSLKQPKKGDLSKYKEFLEKVGKSHENGGETGSTGWQYKFNPEKSAELLLRSQTTAVSARTMMSKDLKIPGKYFTIDRNFRVDEIDWKHLAEFDQVEGIILDPNMNLSGLLGVLKMFAEEVGGAKKFKLVPGYFPYTEPSVELHVYLEGKGWVEIGGAGIFRPEVTKPLGIDVPVLAWGLGILRLFMTKYGVGDMRQVYSTDLKWMREFKW